MDRTSSGWDRRAVLRGMAAGSAAYVLGSLAEPAHAASSGRLARVSPGEAGVDPAAVLAFVDAVEQKVGGLHSFMLLRHGQVAAEAWWAPYAPEHPHMLYSLSKSFTSTAVGLAVSEGHLNVDAPVTSFFPDDLPAKMDNHLKAMRVRHLLSMSTGHAKDATGSTTAAPDGNWARAFLALPVEFEPGTHFVYNSAATYMLSAIVQKLTGKKVVDYLQPRLFEPLGIPAPTWETCPRGINTGGWGLSVRTEDIARFGQLYLRRGKWGDRQVIPEPWVADATSKHISNGDNPNSDWAQGYGYQFWRCRHGAFRGDGAFGQYCVVMPEQDAVLAITSGLGDMQAVLNCAWDHLLPGIGRSGSGSAAELKRRLAALEVHPPQGVPNSPTAKRVSGKTYRMDANDLKISTIRPEFHGDRCTLVVETAAGEQRLEAGAEKWVRGKAPLLALAKAPVAGRGAWENDDTYTMRLSFYESPYVQTLTCRFKDDQLSLESRMNVAFGPTQHPPINGKAA